MKQKLIVIDDSLELGESINYLQLLITDNTKILHDVDVEDIYDNTDTDTSDIINMYEIYLINYKNQDYLEAAVDVDIKTAYSFDGKLTLIDFVEICRSINVSTCFDVKSYKAPSQIANTGTTETPACKSIKTTKIIL